MLVLLNVRSCNRRASQLIDLSEMQMALVLILGILAILCGLLSLYITHRKNRR
jgi:hypothetical protein